MLAVHGRTVVVRRPGGGRVVVRATQGPPTRVARGDRVSFSGRASGGEILAARLSVAR